ncbi:4'-phosphopantetheinyl transferase family protein [Janthinobacterium violaceinigrum]|uniref:4'-phosphopantetheinyl transferase superfamily protein n=1 Tax=Janthinobacterium violaceinigrum TaxID=2654252 RepID=A0A6I1IBM6_9BURK|nr:4'-phosphopantetheinyl transferase superfamily protein [Janthinobacterium violaceinigrum]KAB8064628.1 4'-phosphopantetheinyl transferase superfamily protein [Janthinobacterium violaceinigrum]
MDITVLWSADGVLAIGIAAAMPRAEARLRIRAAVREVAARWLKMDIDAISLESTPGAPPRLLLAGRPAGLSFSHDDGWSVAAVHLHGTVGIDVMRVQDIPDWRQVARDYLGPQVTQELASLPDAQRPLALAQAWTAREAALKCAGLPLMEWDGIALNCNVLHIALEDGFVAMLAIPRKTTGVGP